MKRIELLFASLLVPLDLLSLFLAFILSYYIRDEFSLVSPQSVLGLANKFQYTGADLVLDFHKYLSYLAVIIPAMVIIFALNGLYVIRPQSNWFGRLIRIFIGVSFGEFFILLLFLLKKSFFLPRSTVLYSWILATLLVFIARLLVRSVQKYLYSKNIGVISVVIIGKNPAAERIINQLTSRKYSAYRATAHIEDRSVEDVLTHLNEHAFDELIVVSSTYSSEALLKLRNYCLEQHVAFSFVPPLFTQLQSSFELQALGNQLPVVEVRPTPLEGWGRVLKRLFDLSTVVLLIILFSPLFLLIAVAMKLSSPGPLIFKHRRIGKNAKPIYVWKFRSMKQEYCTGTKEGDSKFAQLLANNPELKKEWESTFKLKNDPRISSIGKILRKTSLDELPQFFNVLQGNLSLVGPRPIVEKEIEKYGETARILFSVRPGVTGLWQVSGRNDVTYSERITMDTAYIEHWSLFGDISIMLRTALVLLSDVLGAVTKKGSKKGAY